MFAAGFIWLGIGMIRIRRWAWALTLVLSWMALVFGLFGLVLMQIMMSRQVFEAASEQAHASPEVITFVDDDGDDVLHVRAFARNLRRRLQPRTGRDTVYRSDPVPRWTTAARRRCSLCIMHAVGAAAPLTSWPYGWTFPVFGFILSGPAVRRRPALGRRTRMPRVGPLGSSCSPGGARCS